MAPSKSPGPAGSAMAYAAAVRLLAGKRLTSAQLAKKLRDRGFAPDCAREAVAECERRRYLDDRTFAQLFVTGALEKKPVGPMRLLRDLTRQGVDADLAREAIANADANEDERIQLAIDKLEASRPGERYDRIARRLQTLGFTPPAIARALRVRGAAGMDIGQLEELT